MKITQLTDWKLAGYWPYAPLQSESMETGMTLIPQTPWIDAKVPGSVQNDLLAAGLIEDPYYEMNSIKAEWVENRFWVYKTTFTVGEERKGQKIILVFEGIDYTAHIYVNNKEIAVHTGMFVPCKLDISEQINYGEPNKLRVVIEQAPNEYGQIGYTSKTSTQKARFGYKWDFSTRLVNLGLYGKAYIEAFDGAHIADTHIRFCDGKVLASITLDDVKAPCRAEVALSYQKEPVAHTTVAFDGGESQTAALVVEAPKLWYPNGYGAQPLYDLTVRITENGKETDCRSYSVGLRTLRFEKCEDAPEDSLPYCVFVNDVPIPIKGVNFTPFDHMYGAVDDARYEKTLTLAAKENVTLIRVWGGGLIESETFYNLCDRLGILVWQDLIQSSSGIENTASSDDTFLSLLRETSAAAIVSKRNHPSLAIWCGGNELMKIEKVVPVDETHKNIAMLKELVERLDSDRLFLPSTASGPNCWYDGSGVKNNHDVHGPWKYSGPDYGYLNSQECLMLGEFGNDGMNNMAALKKILAPENLVRTTMEENCTWAHHGQMWDTYNYRDKPLFGDIDDLETFVSVSQYMQAEGLRYAIECQMRRYPKTAGINIWQFDEPWPNVSCTNLVDYYGNPKFAYYFVRDAYKTFHVSLKHERLAYDKDDVMHAEVHVLDSGEGACGKAELGVRILDADGNQVKAQHTSLQTLSDRTVKALSFELPVKNLGAYFTVECTLDTQGKHDKNTYLLFVKEDGRPACAIRPVLDFMKNYLAQEQF